MTSHLNQGYNVGQLVLRDDTVFKEEITLRIGTMNDMQLLMSRLRVPPGMLMPFEFLNCHVSKGKAFVFVVKGGNSTTLEDDPALFPSDTLITQLRLLLG